MRKGLWVLCVVPLVLTACSREESADESVNESAITEGQLPNENVFSDQVKALEKAKGVEQTLDDAAARQREEIDKQP